jgi:hypothetical protein
MKDLTSRRGLRPIPAPNPNSQTLDRAVPTPQTPVTDDQRASTYITDPKTTLTLPGKIVQIVPATQAWVKATLTLETAGPVEVSNSSQWTFLNGSGQTLIVNVPMPFFVARGNNLYLQSGASNRVKVLIEPLPWLEQIVGGISNGFSKLAGAVSLLAAAIRGK